MIKLLYILGSILLGIFISASIIVLIISFKLIGLAIIVSIIIYYYFKDYKNQ